MTADEVIKGVVGLVLTAIGGVVSWLVKRVLDDREEIIMLKSKVEHLDKEKITQECVREVVEEALEKRDKQAEERRKEWDRRQHLEIRQAVSEEIDKLVPRLVREVRAATGQMRRPSGEGSDA